MEYSRHNVRMMNYNVDLTGNFETIYSWGVHSFQDFCDYLFRFVYEEGLKDVVLNWSVALFIFMLFISFIAGFIFIRRK